MDEFDDQEKVISLYSCQTKWTNSSTVECLSEEPVVQVRVLLRPQ